MIRPPMSSDSEDDDYDGFTFGHKFDDKPSRSANYQWMENQQRENDELNRIVMHIKNGNLDGLKGELLTKYGSESRIKYDDYMKDGWTLLSHAVSNVQIPIVTYLIHEGANVNCEVDSLTPLMLTCKLDAYPDRIDDILAMTQFLIDKGALVDVCDKTGCTPFMYACIQGIRDMVQLLLKMSFVDNTDNNGNTALHYAVENKNFDIVQLLIHAGADMEISNSDGQRPRDIAATLALADIEALFPEEIIDFLPASTEQYQTFKDLAPIVPDHGVSLYAQDIPKMLRGMRVDKCAKKFVEANTSLAEFLTMDDAGLQSVGIEFEFQRKRILLGLLKYHRYPFSPRSIDLVTQKKRKNLYEYFEMYAGYLKHLIMMEAALTYLHKIGGLQHQNVHQGTLNEMLASVQKMHKDLESLQKGIELLSANSTKNPLYIGPVAKPNQRYKNVLRPILKYTIIIGVGILLSCKFIKLLP